MKVMNMLHLNTPPTVLYYPDFVTEEEEKRLISCVNDAPKPKWQQLSHRRLQNWGGIPHPKGMIAEPIPEWLLNYVHKVGSMSLFDDKMPNHVLVNEYLAGQGIMPHTDGPLFYPVITTISLGSHSVLNFQKSSKENENEGEAEGCSSTESKRLSVLVEPRSLLVVKDELYSQYMHSINEITSDVISELVVNPGRFKVGDVLQRSTRISLTIRHVPKTTKAKIFLGR